MLAVDAYPPFSGDEALDYPVRVHIPERKARYSRLKTLFRVIYIIPADLMVLVVGILLYVAVVISWFAILITARDPSTITRSSRSAGCSSSRRCTCWFPRTTDQDRLVGLPFPAQRSEKTH